MQTRGLFVRRSNIVSRGIRTTFLVLLVVAAVLVLIPIPQTKAYSLTNVGMYKSIVKTSQGEWTGDCSDSTRTFETKNDKYAYICFQITLDAQDTPFTLRTEWRGENNREIDSYSFSTITSGDYDPNNPGWNFYNRLDLSKVHHGEVVRVLIYRGNNLVTWDYLALDAYPVRVDVQSLPSGRSVDYLVDGTRAGLVLSDKPGLVGFPIGSTHTISVESPVEISSSERLTCDSCSETVNYEAELTFSYAHEYLVKVTTDPQGISVPDLQAEQWVQEGSSPKIAKEIVNGTSGTQYVFVGWKEEGSAANPQRTLRIAQSTNVIAIFKTQYFVQVASDFGSPRGSGWYDEGSDATVTAQSDFPATGYLDTLGFKWTFSGWSWGATGAPPSGAKGTFKVTSPVRIEAKYSPQPTQRGFLIIGGIIAAVAVGVLALFLLMRRRKHGGLYPSDSTKPMPQQGTWAPFATQGGSAASAGLVGWKHCMGCGNRLSPTARFCNKCGATQSPA